jgi:leucyl-tRNA synthetase
VTEDIEALRFNTAISSLMEFVNDALRWETVPMMAVEAFVKVLSPFAPHISEELWERLGNEPSLADAPWPQWNEDALLLDEIEIAVQVNGKVRGTLAISPDTAREEILAQAKALDNVRRHMEGCELRKEIYVPRRIINLVVSGP